MEKKLIQEFLAESLEGLDRMERCVTALEASPQDEWLVAEIFRTVHTIKGNAGFLDYRRLERLAHASEHVLGGLRSGSLRATSEIVGALLELTDALRAGVRRLVEHDAEDDLSVESDERLIALLTQLGKSGGRRVLPARCSLSGAGGVATESLKNELCVDRTVRVDVAVLNRMMNLVSDLVLTRSQSAEAGIPAARLAELSRHLDEVTAELRTTVVEARLQPVGQLFGRFPRMVRDLALSCGKSARVELAGQETGLDKTLLEAIKDPLIHALRNAVDHGIETAEERVAAGKPAMGTIRVSARQRGGWVLIDVEDDGAGVALDRVRMAAVARGLATLEQAASMPEAEALRMLFLPGFSTMAEVTRVSGRGVGMDVVKETVERAGGSVEVQSREGLGTLLRLRMPMTLAMVPALVVKTAGQSFCVPQSCLAELVHVKRANAGLVVRKADGGRVMRSGGNLVRVLALDRLLGIENGDRALAKQGFYVAVLELEGQRFGLAVDEASISEEIIVKPLSFGLREIELYAGGTVLSNGDLAMILDIATLARLSGIEKAASPAAEWSSSFASSAPAVSVEDARRLEAV
jgi:two-component system chemotaxis sensor kinase CheA